MKIIPLFSKKGVSATCIHIAKISFVLTGILAFTQTVNAARPPLMGWASWNNFGVNISETVIVGQADAMVSSGLANVGFKYINIDDGFFDGRGADGSLHVNATKFPHGMKAVADYIHACNLKAGFYSDAGPSTCGSLNNGQTGGTGDGLYNHDQQDIDSVFKDWDYDYIKVDWCGGAQQSLDEETRYTAIRKAIDNTGRDDISFNVCRWNFPGKFVTNVADSWRISGDITNSWASVTSIIDQNAFMAVWSSPGHYNDMDMLEVGRGMTAEEDKSHFSMWCIFTAPLVLGNDLTSLSQQTKTILTNTEAIAVDQDTTEQAHIVTDKGDNLQVWAKNLNGKQSPERAVALLNRTSASASMSVKWRDLLLDGSATVRDLWLHKDLGTMDSMYTVTVPSHGVVMLKVVGTKTRLQEVFEAEYGWINNYNKTLNSSFVSNQGRASRAVECSGCGEVGYIGSSADNYVEFRNIYADSTKTYTLTLSYLSGENRNLTVTVNGVDTLLTNLNSGGYTTVATKTFPVRLNRGNNIIRLSNATGWAPDLDKIQINLNQNVSPSTGIDMVTKEVLFRVYPNPSSSSMRIESDAPVQKVEIYSLDGILLKSTTLTNVSVSNLNTGTYLMKVTTEKGSTCQQIIKK